MISFGLTVDGWTYDFCKVAIAARAGQAAMCAVPFIIALMTENPFTIQARVGHHNDQRQVEMDTFKGALNNNGSERVTQTKKEAASYASGSGATKVFRSPQRT